ncbi:hypothetical protein PHMEG_0002194 [Phytophthora megakarya]|uniref:Sugar transporter SWEET1 n=1 Tax=Phytophthora megakarya TaxID=4795 RepID=A0A225WYV0_9STRA|nr:hypothetical protein PHMEG_0002194 [Phytophthora megakarya]
MRISLFPDFQRMRKRRGTGDMSVIPCVLLYTHCFALLFYAYVIDDMVPLFATSVLGVVVGVILAYFFYRWTDNKRKVLKIFAISFVVCFLVATYSILAMAGITGQSNSSIGTTLGFVTIGTTIGLYISPMSTIALVLRTKTSSSMPFTMGVVNVLNTICWLLYSALVDNIFILAPNIAGLVLGSTQLILTFIYPRQTTIDEGAILPTGTCSPVHNTRRRIIEPHDTVLAFEIITIVTTIFMRISLLPDFQRMRKMKSTGDMSVLPCVLLYANCYLLCWYSYAVDNIIPLFLTAALGVISGAILAVFFYKWTAHKRDVMKIFIISGIIMLLETIYGVIALVGWTGQSRSSTGTTLGVLVIISSVGLYASPMATIRHVLRTKTSTSMPFTMGVVNIINSFCWVVYAILVDDIFILVPNASGALLGSIQLILTFIYPRKAPSEGQIISARSLQASLSVVIHSPAQDDRENRKSNAGEGPNFAALRSPET